VTQITVQAYGVGLLGLVAVKILAPGYYARQNVRTPMLVAVFTLILTQVLNLAFVPWLRHAGLALSISVAALANALLLGAGLARQGLYRPAAGWAGFLARIGLALATMAVVLVYGVRQFDWIALAGEPWLRVALVLGLLSITATVYLAVLFALGIRPRDFSHRD
jgi:putative peptidoglycan lipid II flippase